MFRNLLLLASLSAMTRLLPLAGADAGGSGDGRDTTASNGKDQSPEQAFTKLLERYNGDTRAVASTLFDENWKLRNQRRLLNDQVTDLSKQVPQQGSVTLTAGEAADWEAYRQLGTPQNVKQGLERATTLDQQLQTTQKEQRLAEVAQVTGYNVAPLKRVAADLEFEVKEVDDNGQKAKRAYVVQSKPTADGKAQERTLTPIEEFAASNWADMIPALVAQQQQQQAQPQWGAGRTTGNGAEGQSGRRFVKQPGPQATTTRQVTPVDMVMGKYSGLPKSEG